MLALTLHSPIEGTAREVFILIEKSSIAICNWMSVSVIYSHLVPEIQKPYPHGPKQEARSPELCVRSVVHHLVPDHAVDDVEGPGDRRENCVQDCHLQTEKTAPMKRGVTQMTFSGTQVNF